MKRKTIFKMEICGTKDWCERFKVLPPTHFGDHDYVDSLKYSLDIRLLPGSSHPTPHHLALGVYFEVVWKLWNIWAILEWGLRSINSIYKMLDLEYINSLTISFLYEQIFYHSFAVSLSVGHRRNPLTYCTSVTAATSHRQLQTLRSDILSQPECHKVHMWIAQGPLIKSATELRIKFLTLPTQLPCLSESVSIPFSFTILGISLCYSLQLSPLTRASYSLCYVMLSYFASNTSVNKV